MISEIVKNVYFIGLMHWERRLFDQLIPLPDGTSYNAYLIKDKKITLIDTADPSKRDDLLNSLEKLNVKKIDYIVSHHTEQDHSGSIPDIIEKYKEAKIIASRIGKDLLREHLDIPEGKISIVDDGEILSIGRRKLKFIYAPWVHWPETMLTYLVNDRILFTCDLFGSHLATSRVYADENDRIYEAAKRYYAEIMMPFRNKIKSHIKKILDLNIDIIAPSHGPIYREPKSIIDYYRDWVSDTTKNEVVLIYVSMHGSIEQAVNIFTEHLEEKNLPYRLFDLSVTDIGELAMALVDASTVVFATPTVLGGAHPIIMYAASLSNALRPKTKFASFIVSYGWGGRALDQLADLLKNLRVGIINPVIFRGTPKSDTREKLRSLAEEIYKKHREIGVV